MKGLREKKKAETYVTWLTGIQRQTACLYLGMCWEHTEEPMQRHNIHHDYQRVNK